MPHIGNKQELIAFFKTVTLAPGFTSMESFGLTFNEDDCLFCVDCEAVEPPSSFYVERPVTDEDNGRMVCTNCYNDLQNPERSCSGCGTRLRHFNNPRPVVYFHNGQNHEGEVCRECHGIGRYHVEYAPCGSCGNYDAQERFNEADGQHMCGNCLNRNYHFCEHCDEYHRNNGRRNGIPAMKLAGVNTIDINRIIEAEHIGLAAVV